MFPNTCIYTERLKTLLNISAIVLNGIRLYQVVVPKNSNFSSYTIGKSVMVATIVRYMINRQPLINVDLSECFKSAMTVNISKTIAPQVMRIQK